ncbi:MAG: sulfatase-like hydrolase/transferase [Phycisphaera sp.]|nr:sulfatase-like hydrolase/transferase [Phycisphaera sp.]
MLSRGIIRYAVLACAALVFALVSTGVLRAAEPAPNVILIMADDLGYHDLSCYGHPKIKTPVLDGLAAEGVRLTSFYSGATVCTPSRMALMTGAYAWRTGWKQGVAGYKMGSTEGMSPDALTVAEAFRSAGYATGMAGKWHIGERPECLPNGQGFDSAYYITKSNNQTKKLWRDGKLVEDPFENRLLTEKFTAEAIRFVKANSGGPFFLYLPYTAPHFPVEAHPDWKGKSDFGEYGDVVEELDHRIGDLLGVLRDEEIDGRTIVVFLSDNGPQPGQQSSADPLRGLKWDALEGGNRVPCIVRWPGEIPPGQTCDQLVAAIDLMPTLCAACGIDLAKVSRGVPKIDGLNVLDTLRGRAESPRRELMLWQGMGEFQAIRVGKWKLFLNRAAATKPNNRNTDEANARLAAMSKGDGPVLFNLDEDVQELDDVSDRYPDQVKLMQQLAEQRLADVQSNVLPTVK